MWVICSNKDGGCAEEREQSQREGPVVGEGGEGDLSQRLPLPPRPLPPTPAPKAPDSRSSPLAYPVCRVGCWAAVCCSAPWLPFMPLLTSWDSGMQDSCLVPGRQAGTQWRTTAREAGDWLCANVLPLPPTKRALRPPGSWGYKSCLCSQLISTSHHSAGTSGKGWWMPNLEKQHPMLGFILNKSILKLNNWDIIDI